MLCIILIRFYVLYMELHHEKSFRIVMCDEVCLMTGRFVLLTFYILVVSAAQTEAFNGFDGWSL